MIVANCWISSNVAFERLNLIAVLFTIAFSGAVSADVPEPDHYRMELYDDLVPATLKGAETVSAAQVLELQQSKDAVVIDVIPEHRKPEYLPENQLWIPVPHKGVPNAVWLPDIGFGALSEVTERYFQSHLAEATSGDKHHPVVFYCRSDCWMSWNAAKRALTYGYTSVYWFRDGIDDWFFEGFDFAILKPAPGQRQ